MKKFLSDMNELNIKNKLIELFPEAHGFITGSVDIPVVVSCWINYDNKITSNQLNEIRELLNEYLIDFNFRYNKNNLANDRFIRFKVEIKGWKN